MPNDSDIIISDTNCLIILSKIGEQELLNKMGKEVFVTPAIRDEFGEKLPEWIRVVAPANSHYQRLLEMDLDKGEASAIALSMGLKNAILLLDDLKGRIIADRLKLRYSGTFGLILRAKQTGVVQTVEPILKKIRATNFRFSEKLIQAVLREAGEGKG